jgi:ADP-ribose pyrophosphatase YjhB (NUDIX family)
MTQHPHSFSRYCMHCGQRLATAVPEGDKQRRFVCMDCGFIHYINPRPVAGAIPVDHRGEILLVRRAIEPRIGTWVFPGGFMDVGETAEEAAMRETMEEANLAVSDLSLLGVYTRTGPGVVVVVYEALAQGRGSVGDESLEIGWFAPDRIPWADLAFDTTNWALKDWMNRRGHALPPEAHVEPKAGR